MSLIGNVFLTVAAHFSKLIMGFFLLKLIAFYLGAEALGQLGNFMSVLTLLGIIAGGGIINGVIKYTSEYKFNKIKLIKFLSSAIGYSIIFSILLLLISVLFSRQFSKIIFGSSEYYLYIILLGFSQFGFAFSSLVIGVSNGLGNNNVYANIQISACVLSIPFCWILIDLFAFPGAIFGLIFSVLASSIPSLWFVKKSKLTKFLKISIKPDKNIFFLIQFTLMFLVSAFTFPLVEILIRTNLIVESNYHEAGIWQAGIRLSSAYTGLFSVFLAYWFMPRISIENNYEKIKNKTIKIMCFIFVFFAFGAVVFYLGRNFFIPIMLSNDFSELQDIIFLQLVGDFFKIGAYTIGYVIVAKAMTRVYIFGEILQNILFILSAYFFQSFIFGAEAIMTGYMAAYMIYFVICFVAFLFFCNYSNLKKNGRK